MKIVNGDCIEIALKEKDVVIPHVTNNIGAWGSGFVIALSNKWPTSLQTRSPEFEYKREGRGKSLGFTQFVEVEPTKSIFVANMCAQRGISSKSHKNFQYKPRNEKPLRYKDLLGCMEQVKCFCVDYHKKIVCPKFGSDRAGGNWDFITELIEEIWEGMDVTVCCLPVRKKS